MLCNKSIFFKIKKQLNLRTILFLFSSQVQNPCQNRNSSTYQYNNSDLKCPLSKYYCNKNKCTQIPCHCCEEKAVTKNKNQVWYHFVSLENISRLFLHPILTALILLSWEATCEICSETSKGQTKRVAQSSQEKSAQLENTDAHSMRSPRSAICSLLFLLMELSFSTLWV